ncbi:MnuA family membrane nuclease [Mycoplasma sp. 3341]|uniref:MnuA family membrane nuclease n=1 Tax=Mycoplasma sp. 3341 TaxID=3447506 RepID=UPI003F65C17F
MKKFKKKKLLITNFALAGVLISPTAIASCKNTATDPKQPEKDYNLDLTKVNDSLDFNLVDENQDNEILWEELSKQKILLFDSTSNCLVDAESKQKILQLNNNEYQLATLEKDTLSNQGLDSNNVNNDIKYSFDPINGILRIKYWLVEKSFVNNRHRFDKRPFEKHFNLSRHFKRFNDFFASKIQNHVLLNKNNISLLVNLIKNQNSLIFDTQNKTINTENNPLFVFDDEIKSLWKQDWILVNKLSEQWKKPNLLLDYKVENNTFQIFFKAAIYKDNQVIFLTNQDLNLSVEIDNLANVIDTQKHDDLKPIDNSKNENQNTDQNTPKDKPVDNNEQDIKQVDDQENKKEDNPTSPDDNKQQNVSKFDAVYNKIKDSKLQVINNKDGKLQSRLQDRRCRLFFSDELRTISWTFSRSQTPSTSTLENNVFINLSEILPKDFALGNVSNSESTQIDFAFNNKSNNLTLNFKILEFKDEGNVESPKQYLLTINIDNKEVSNNESGNSQNSDNKTENPIPPKVEPIDNENTQLDTKTSFLSWDKYEILNIMHWNIKNYGNSWMSENSFKVQAIAKIISQQKPDIFGLTEINDGRSDQVQYIVDVLNKLTNKNYKYIAQPENESVSTDPRYEKSRESIAIIYDSNKVEPIPFSTNKIGFSFLEQIANKRYYVRPPFALQFKLKANPKRSISTIFAHFDSPGAGRREIEKPSQFYKGQGEQEVAEALFIPYLLNIVKRISNPDSAIIFGADTNIIEDTIFQKIDRDNNGVKVYNFRTDNSDLTTLKNSERAWSSKYDRFLFIESKDIDVIDKKEKHSLEDKYLPFAYPYRYKMWDLFKKDFDYKNVKTWIANENPNKLKEDITRIYAVNYVSDHAPVQISAVINLS